MSLGTNYFPTVPVGGTTSYKLWPVFTYSNGYWEVYRRFQGDFRWGGGRVRKGDMLGELSMEEFVTREKIQWTERRIF